MEIAPGYAHIRRMPTQRQQGGNHADGLRQRGAQRRARRAHAQRAHEQVIQRNVGRTGHGDKIHGALGIAHAAKNGADDIIRRNEGNAKEANGKIAHRALHGSLGRRHQAGNRARAQQQHRRQHQRQRGKQRHRIADTGSRFFVLLRADCLADGYGRAHGQPHHDDGEHMHHLTADGHRRGAGHALILPDNKQISHPIQRLQKKG